VLSQDRARATGHAILHRTSGLGVACAAGHPEGGEDGRVWTFDNATLRRTQSLQGGVLDLAPFHWSGDLPDLAALVDETFVERMAGPKLDMPQLGALSRWVHSLEHPPQSPASDPAAVTRGTKLFTDQKVGCASCHSGPAFTNRSLMDVGTGGKLKVPSLRGVAWRAPFLHHGCAKTLRDRFGPCGGGDQHGQTSQLTASQVDDLVAYLDTL
jgi:hypothetical protein